MSDLTAIEKRKLEKHFQMGGGVVCNFSNRTFANQVLDSIGLDVYVDKYKIFGESKANRLRALWKIENNYTISKLLIGILEYWKAERTLLSVDESMWSEAFNPELHEECLKIAERLKNNTAMGDLDALEQYNLDDNYELLTDSIKTSILKDKPDQAIDRMHTFTIKRMRLLCDKHNIKYSKDTFLHTLFGNYVKFLEENKLIQSEMSLRILKSSISILDAFNSVRNSHSLAHDNEILNRNESILIFSNIFSLIKFIDAIEESSSSNTTNEIENIPF
ncbi:MAG: abortive infection family protein [Patescibacteria group bacterium]